MKIDYIVVRIKTEVKVIFEDEFIDGNPFKTQNEIIEVLSKLYRKEDFNVEYITHYTANYKLNPKE